MLWRSMYLSVRTAKYTKILVSVNTFETITKLLRDVPGAIRRHERKSFRLRMKFEIPLF